MAYLSIEVATEIHGEEVANLIKAALDGHIPETLPRLNARYSSVICKHGNILTLVVQNGKPHEIGVDEPSPITLPSRRTPLSPC